MAFFWDSDLAVVHQDLFGYPGGADHLDTSSFPGTEGEADGAPAGP